MNNLTKQTEFDLDSSESTVNILYFSALWCGPCKQLGPIVDELSLENPETTFWKHMVGEEGLEVGYKVRSLPTLVFLKEGKEEGRLVGAQSKKVIQDKINSLVEDEF